MNNTGGITVEINGNTRRTAPVGRGVPPVRKLRVKFIGNEKLFPKRSLP